MSLGKHIGNFLFAFLYGSCFHLLQFFLSQRDMVKKIAGNNDLVRFDASWYKSLAEKGYEYFDFANSNSGFYPLFSFIWRITGLSPWGISFVNIFFLACGFALFTSLYKLTAQEKFIWLSIPSMYFCFIPYTESLFILLGSLVFFGIVRQNKWLTWTGLFLLSLSRPVALTLIPAFLFTELIMGNRNEWYLALVSAVKKYVWPLLAGTALFIWYQHHITGVWFAYFIQQSKFWAHEFSWPKFPLGSLFGPKLLWLDALAMFLCFMSLAVLIKKGLQWLIKNEPATDKLLLLSYNYFTGILLATLFFNPKWGILTTNVFDVHRYIFVSPFFWIFLYRYTSNIIYKPASFLWIFLATNAFWLLFASYNHIQYLLYFNFGTLFIFLYMLYANKRMSWPALAIAAIQVFLQVQMFQFFIDEIYPG